MLQIQTPQIRQIPLEILPLRIFRQSPVESSVGIPLVPWGQFGSHKQKLFAGMGIHVPQEDPQIGKTPPFIAGHFSQERPFAVDHLIVGERQDKILAVGIHHGKGEPVVVILTMNGLLPEVQKGVVHPSHVPFEAETKAPKVGRGADPGPGRGLFSHGKAVRKKAVDRFVQLPEKIDRLHILVSAVAVGDPLSPHLAVVQIEHGRHGIDPEPVNMVLVQPEQGIGDEKIANLVSAEIEDEGPPIRMFPLAGILVFVEGRAVKQPQAPVIFWKMGGDPIDNDADTVLVTRVDEKLKIVGGAESACRGIVPRDLITPRGIERMLGHGQKLHMGKAKLFHVLDELGRQLPIGQPAILFFRNPHP